jgi:hypothetical protein
MKLTIYDCWNCRHRNDDNPYGMGYCEVHDTRCSFAYDDCDDFEPDGDGNDHHSEPACRLTLIGGYLLGIITALLLCWLMTGCTTTEYVPMPEVHEHWHHSTDTIHKTDSVIDRQTTTIREVDSATMAQYGIQIRAMQTAWLIQTERLQREISALRVTRTDTIHERDSIPYPVEVVKQVPRERSTVEWVLLIIGLLAIAWIIIRIAIKIKHV